MYPALAVGASLRASAEPPLDLHLVGTHTGLERRLFEESGLPAHYLMARPMPARKGLKWLVNAGYLSGAVVQAHGLVRRLRPHAVVGTGGYASVPVLRAASSRGVPTHIHEMDAYAGRANRMLAARASSVSVGFEPALAQLGRPDGQVTGNPLREGFGAPDPGSARERFGLDPVRPLILVFGGSRGALAINEAMVPASEALIRDHGAQVLLITGRDHLGHCKGLATRLTSDCRRHLHLIEYVAEGMPDLMAAAQLAITRSGAATVSELAAARLPAILIPYPYAMADHQRANASVLEAAGAAAVVDQEEAVRPGFLEGLAGSLLKEKPRLQAMGEAAYRCARLDAADRIAQIVLELASRTRAEE